MQPNQTVFYVQDITTTIELYTEILTINPIEHHPTYASFQLEGGYLIAFWCIDDVTPSVTELGNSSELVFQLPTKEAVDQCFQRWVAKLDVLQKPTVQCFGYGFLALDHNQIKLRVYTNE